MTVLETRDLDIGDLVACGKHIGRVAMVTTYAVLVEWKPGTPVTHRRDQMAAIRRAEKSEQGT